MPVVTKPPCSDCDTIEVDTGVDRAPHAFYSFRHDEIKVCFGVSTQCQRLGDSRWTSVGKSVGGLCSPTGRGIRVEAVLKSICGLI